MPALKYIELKTGHSDNLALLRAVKAAL